MHVDALNLEFCPLLQKWNHTAHISLLLTFLTWNITAISHGKRCSSNSFFEIVAFIDSIAVPQVTQTFPYWWTSSLFFTLSHCRSCCIILMPGYFSFYRIHSQSRAAEEKCMCIFNCDRSYYTIFPKDSSNAVSCFEPLQFLGWRLPLVLPLPLLLGAEYP